MLIERIYLKGLKPFLTNNVTEIDYHPQSQFQIIIGTNGSGKSSLIREASPLPANKKDFVKGGMKELICNKDGKRFRLVSDFSHDNDHFFYIDDGPNLNEGKKITMQRQLVAQYFNGYDDDIHELLVGDGSSLFTNMSTVERRKWFTRLNTSDMTYALRFYNDLRSKMRDTTGAMQHLKKRLTEEQSKFNALDNIDGLDIVINNLKKEIVHLLELKDSNNRLTGEQAYNAMQQGLQRSIIKSNEMKKVNVSFFRKTITKLNLSNINELKDLQEQVIVDINVKENTLNLNLKELEGMGRNLSSIRDARQGEVNKLNEQKQQILALIKDHQSHLKRFTNVQSASQIYQRSIGSVLPMLKNIIMEFDVEEDDDFTKDSILKLRKQVEGLNKHIGELKTSCATLQIRKKHVQETHNVDCPKCKYVFKPGVEEDELTAITKRIVEHEERLEDCEKKYKDLMFKFNRSEDFLKCWRGFKAVVDSNNDHDQLWQEINNLKVKVFVKSLTLPILSDWEDDLYIAAQIDNLNNELRVIEELIGNDKNGSNEIYDELITQRANQIELEIEKINDSVYVAKDLLKNLQKCIEINDKIESIKYDLKQIFDDFIKDNHVYNSSISNDYINQQLINLNSELMELESKMHEKEKYATTISMINDDLRVLDKQAQGFKSLINELNPTDGLIAEYLNDNIGRIIETMNDVVEDVWTYALKIQPCSIESGDLNYEFPFLVKEFEEPIEDVKRGSTAQKEMFNFVFKLTAMWFLGLEGYPLFLDELGASFDYQHRGRILDYVKNLIYNNEFSQMFYISQYASTHDSFASADICVTDPSNVIVPATYNQFVTFK